MDSESVNKRIYYHRSWSTSFSLGVVSTDELSQKLERMISGVDKEQDEAFGVIRTCAITKRSDDSFANFAFAWMQNHLTAAKSPIAKYHVVDSTWALLGPDLKNPRIGHFESIKKILTMVQPISSEDLGTWRQVEYVLVGVIHRDKRKFVDLLASNL